ncbi:MAG: ribosome maturation factor RimM [Candidatus Latescibacterota bacterium]
MAWQGRIAVARITRTKGVAGHVRAEALTHDVRRFARLREVVVEKPGQPDRRLVLEEWHPERGGVLLRFAGVDSPEEARMALCGGYVTVAPEETAPLPADTYYVFELVGCTVEDEQGRPVGRIVDVLEMPSTDVYRVLGETGEVLVPAVANFVVLVSIPEKRVVVRGLAELL